MNNRVALGLMSASNLSCFKFSSETKQVNMNIASAIYFYSPEKILHAYSKHTYCMHAHVLNVDGPAYCLYADLLHVLVSP